MLEVNPGSETKLSGFTAVSGFRGGDKRKTERRGYVSSFFVPSSFLHTPSASPYPTSHWGVLPS